VKGGKGMEDEEEGKSRDFWEPEVVKKQEN